MVNHSDMKPMQGIITKCLFEMNHAKMFEEVKQESSKSTKAASTNDDEWLES